MEAVIINPLVCTIIVVLTLIISLSTLSVHEGLTSNLSIKTLILSKARLVLKELIENQRLNATVHLQILLGLILTASLFGEVGHNLNLILVGILLMSSLSYQLLTNADDIDQPIFFHGLVEVVLTILLLAVMKDRSGWSLLVLGVSTYFVVSTLSFRSTSLGPWQEKREGYIVEVLSTEIVKYWVIASLALKYIHLELTALRLLAVGVIYIIAKIIINPIIRGSMAKRSTRLTLVQKTFVILISVTLYLGFNIWRGV